MNSAARSEFITHAMLIGVTKEKEMDIGRAAEVFEHHIDRLSGGLSPTAREEMEAAVAAFKVAARTLDELQNRTLGQIRFGSVS